MGALHQLHLLVPQYSLAGVFFINWSKADLESINADLENLPEVFKFAPPSKRTCGEPLSLYACLDAFLREEPLVSEEMCFCKITGGTNSMIAKLLPLMKRK